MKFNRHILPFICFLMFAGCAKILDYQLPPEAPIPVVAAFFSPDSTININLTGSRHVLDNNTDFKPFEADEVLVFQDNEVIGEALHTGEGNYRVQNYLPEPGATYSIEISKNDYPLIRASETIPSTIPDFSILSYRLVEEDWSFAHEFDLQVTNPAEPTYFEIVVLGTQYRYEPNSQDQIVLVDSSTVQLNIYSNDPIADNSNDIFAERSLLIGNELIKPGSFTFRFNVAHIPYESDSYDSLTHVGITIVLRHVSEGYYNFIRSFRLHQYAAGDPLAEPVQVYNNIENGLGIFGCYVQKGEGYLVPFPFY